MEIKVKGLYLKRGWYYYGRMRQGTRAIIALKTQNLDEAIARARELEAQPELLAPEEAKVEVDRFIQHKLSLGEYSRFSAENKVLTLYRFAEWLKEIRLERVTSDHIQKFYTTERKRVAESTAQGYILTVRSFFNYLRDVRRVVEKNPAEKVKMGIWDYGTRVKFCLPKDRDFLLREVLRIPKSILPADTALMLAFVLHCGFESGLRRNEIIEARPTWFDLDQKSLRVQETDTFRPKDREARSIPMTDVLIKFLRKYPLDGGWCIAPGVVRGKSRYRYDFLNPFLKFLRYVSEKTGRDFTWITPHVMRHTFASVLIHNDVSLSKVAKWMGDDHRTTERHYAHLVEGDPAINNLRTHKTKRDC